MKVLGITGGVGSGKSEVLLYLREAYGAYICQMDETARELQRRGTACFQKITDYFGNSVIGRDGELDRTKLGQIIFSDRGAREALNRIVHPEVLRRTEADIAEKRSEGTPLYVVEAALFPEVGSELCDELWYIYSEEKIRRERLKNSRGYTEEKIMRMIASQPGEDAFRRICTAVIDNSGSFEDTKRQIGERLKL